MLHNERQIIRKLLSDAAALGYFVKSISFMDDDVEEYVLSNDHTFELLDGCSEAILNFTNSNMPPNTPWVSMIFDNGNHGLDLISDYTTKYDDWDKMLDELQDWINLMAVPKLPEIKS